MTASPQQCRPKASACRTLVQPEPLLQVKVVGLFKSSSFQVSKTIAEVSPPPDSTSAAAPCLGPASAGGVHVLPSDRVGVWRTRAGREEGRTGKREATA
ncbi:hypothetical protein NN561_017710 [Cricetulus griseus]